MTDHEVATTAVTASVRPEGLPRVLAVVVTWNSAEYVVDCLRSLLDSSRPVDAIIVDNCSSDKTVALVEEEFPDIEIVETGSNLGYSGANNIGLRFAQVHAYDFAFIVNPDCAVDRDCVARLSSSLQEYPALAAASPVIFRNDRLTVWYSGASTDTRFGTSYHRSDSPQDLVGDEIRLTPRASGCAMMLRVSALQAVGLLDERYFLYYEETDWCLRCTAAGLAIAVVPSACAFHDLGHGSAGVSEAYHYYMTRNRLLLVKIYEESVLPALPHCLYTSFYNLTRTMFISPAKALTLVGSIAKGYLDFAFGRVGEQVPNYRWWPRMGWRPGARSARTR
jgi:GT2 family glycosyltransferase